MKNLIFKTLFFISVITFTSCASQKTVKLGNGKYVTEREYKKRIKRAHRETMREMSKEDRKILKGVKITLETYD